MVPKYLNFIECFMDLLAILKSRNLEAASSLYIEIGVKNNILLKPHTTKGATKLYIGAIRWVEFILRGVNITNVSLECR